MQLDCEFKSSSLAILRYFRYIGEWCETDLKLYDEKARNVLFSGTEPQIAGFLNAFLFDFSYDKCQGYYLKQKEWQFLKASQTCVELPHAHVIVITHCSEMESDDST